ncbi:AGAP000119-PA-like protein [Anopheles sinensis]|uniref:AGAP000119-PA-like protein n=1 Tax=Anopheles sinensis TaxID=74873 RepID=A0A084WF24_ANOSI|nr:AGAP000119-PA-like protein [Anopheles sinensis]
MTSNDENIVPARQGGFRGVSRVLGKLKSSIESKNFYEAHQMYRTLYFRYVSQGKYQELLELLYQGALTMLDNEQYSSGADLALLIIQTLESAGCTVEDNEEWMNRISVLIGKIKPNIVERETVVEKAMKWSGTISKSAIGHPLMHKLMAKIVYRENNLIQAQHHFALSKDSLSCVFVMIEVSIFHGYRNETDLFIAQLVLQMLCLKDPETACEMFAAYIKFHPLIARTEPPFPMPLLNFLYFLLEAIGQSDRKYAVFRALCELYKPSLDRDPSYDKYLRRIGAKYFGAKQQEQSRGFVFGDLLNQFFHDLDAEFGDDAAALQEGSSEHGEVD